MPVILFSDVKDIGLNSNRYERIKRLGLSIEKKPNVERNTNIQKVNQSLKQIAQRLHNVFYVDITPYINDLLEQKELIYYDSDHLNPYGSRELGKLFIQNQELKLE